MSPNLYFDDPQKTPLRPQNAPDARDSDATLLPLSPGAPSRRMGAMQSHPDPTSASPRPNLTAGESWPHDRLKSRAPALTLRVDAHFVLFSHWWRSKYTREFGGLLLKI